ncbi:MAG: hypothetical protein M1827_001619 [Pycnora praestabilis]|nr:MAG: hypothetical protein M1827_001619 [Pycnora praestabilis]
MSAMQEIKETMTESDLIFRDETQVTERRAFRASFPDRSSGLPAGSSSSEMESLGKEIVRIGAERPFHKLLLTVPQTIVDHPEQAALCFFFTNYVLIPRHAESLRGYIEHLLPIYSTSKPNSHLTMTTTAISLAAVTHFPDKRHLRPLAQLHYVKALSLLNRALQDRSTAVTDETLMSVMLMSFYESIVNGSFPAAGSHVEGATALIKLRGKEQFRRKISLQLFHAVRAQIISSCIVKSKPVDDLPFDEEETENPWKQNAATRLTIYTLKIPALRVAAKGLLASPFNQASIGETKQLLQDAKEIDETLASWPNSLPKEWNYVTISRTDVFPENIETADSYPGNIDVYYDLQVASTWNSYRTCRLFILEIMMQCIVRLAPSPNDVNGDPDYLSVFETIQRLLNELCATVPFYLSYRHSAGTDNRYPYEVNNMESENRRLTVTLGGYFIRSPLLILEGMDCIPEYQRRWVRGRISYLNKVVMNLIRYPCAELSAASPSSSHYHHPAAAWQP